jgi:alpha,alpha-trehalose-phosphate synthase [UDP-forming]
MSAKDKRRVVVVANRGPYRKEGAKDRPRWVRSSGGLVTALDPVLRSRGGRWVSAAEGEDERFRSKDKVPDLEYELPTVRIPKARQRGFYGGVSNAVLWPLLHSFPPTVRVGGAPWHHYVEANRSFASVVLDESDPEDLIWVQDYHLMLVPGMLREQRPRARIGWFCHIPWPSSDLFRVLPLRLAIIEGLLGADLVGFHTTQYAQHFLECVERLTSYPVDRERATVRIGDRTVEVVAAPIGIPVSDVEQLAADPEVNRHAEELRSSVDDRTIILGVDRLDYTKGIPERILAYEELLRRDRAARNRFVYVQVMVPSRTDVKAYADLKQEVDRLVGHVNGRFASTGRVAIHYLYRSLDKPLLYAHYRAADIGLVTPLRDGMNLVAHEYCASRVEQDGCLVLSEFAGAAEYLKGAIQVNAHDYYAIADALEEAIALSPEDRSSRMASLRNGVRSLDVHRWADAYLKKLEGHR